MNRTCEFSPCRRYRYTLWRQWDTYPLALEWDAQKYAGYLMVIGLNPSTADETNDDPTIRRCIGFAKRWGFGALCMTNLFAFRATNPEVMKGTLAPIGETIDSNTSVNDQWLRKIASDAGMILAAWGKHGSHLGRANCVFGDINNSFRSIHCLRTNKDGSPMHPLYVPAETNPSLWQPA